ncbi:MAG TPA: DUF5933 domain-containing protein [Mycobacterium sp.]
MFIGDVRGVGWSAPSTRTWVTVVVALALVLLAGLQIAAAATGLQGPLHSLASDFVATPKSATVPWVGLSMAMVGLPNRWRIAALLAAVSLDGLFATERLLRTGVFAVGNGPLIVLTVLAVLVWLRTDGAQRRIALGGVACGLLVVVAIKIGEVWLRLTTIIRPTVWDEYVMLADHALAQPSWWFGRVFAEAGPVATGVLHWVYIELPAAAMVVAVYQLRNVRSEGWPHHFLVRTFLVLGLIGPAIYVLFPVVGPEYIFGVAGGSLRVGDYWPQVLPPTHLSPGPVVFDGSASRNCMPSMHTAWALAVFIHSRRGPRWLRWGGALWLVGTLAATLGFGYHYGVDLVAGAVLCLTVEAALREPVAGRGASRLPVIAAGAAFLAALLIGCRYAAVPMAHYPLLFGPLIIGLLAVFAIAFYATFFGRPAAVIRDTLVVNLAGVQPHRAEPEFG